MSQIEKNYPCVTLIGMAGAGKTTIGSLLAQKLGWAFMDTDNLIESLYGARLQRITDALGKEAFMDVECSVILGIRPGRCVIATGGSVVHRKPAMKHLTALGPVIHIHASLEKILERIARNPERGIAIDAGEKLEDLITLRQELYRKWAMDTCDSEKYDPHACSDFLFNILSQKFGIAP